MKKYKLFFCFLLFNYNQSDPKIYKLELDAQEIEIIYNALGDLPAKKSELIRYKIVQQINQQNTIKK